jgi:hydroxymethylpyrimidine pyrophosphatase-like HAD family hydrolase
VFGLSIVASSIQIHLHGDGIEKGRALYDTAAELGIEGTKGILAIGDSANDESMFDPHHAEISCAVANIAPYLDRMKIKPAYILDKEGGQGAAELFEAVFAAKQAAL